MECSTDHGKEEKIETVDKIYMKTDRKDLTSLYVIVSFASNHIIMVLFYDHRGAVWRGGDDIAVKRRRRGFFFDFFFF